jgi:hypothetical protein
MLVFNIYIQYLTLLFLIIAITMLMTTLASSENSLFTLKCVNDTKNKQRGGENAIISKL